MLAFNHIWADQVIGDEGRREDAEDIGEEVGPLAPAVGGEIFLQEFDESAEGNGTGDGADPGVPERAVTVPVVTQELQPEHARHAAVHAEVDELVEPGEEGYAQGGRVEERQVNDGQDDQQRERVLGDVVEDLFHLRTCCVRVRYRQSACRFPVWYCRGPRRHGRCLRCRGRA